MPPKGAFIRLKRSREGTFFSLEAEMLGEFLSETRRCGPLVHCITNYVTACDCANILLACGSSAIMADDPEESAEITALCRGLVLNMGTPGPRKTEAMFRSGEEANRLGIPVILDPVGVGASALRRNTGRELLRRLRFAAIRGNASEIATLSAGSVNRRGVDTNPAEASPAVAEENALSLSRETGAVVISTGSTDIVTDGKRLWRVHNGHPLMRMVSGTGCQLSALLGAFIAANPARAGEASLAAVCAMGLAGERAHGRLSPGEGPAALRSRIIDEIFHMTPEILEEGAKYEPDM